jgi:hypothetical protein
VFGNHNLLSNGAQTEGFVLESGMTNQLHAYTEGQNALRAQAEASLDS